MNEPAAAFAGHVEPVSAWRAISTAPGAFMVDVRSEAEWVFVGAPDLGECGKPLWRIAWKSFPGMTLNPDFFDELAAKIDESGASDVFFLCRSGGRSFEAASQAAARMRPERGLSFYNVAEGFEGDLDGEGRRGRVNGWKSHGLPWRQG